MIYLYKEIHNNLKKKKNLLLSAITQMNITEMCLVDMKE